MDQSLWDVMGIDALAAMTEIFGTAVGQLAPFQSLETVLDGQNCSVLRLCDLNFRIADAPTLSNYCRPQHFQICLHQFNWVNRCHLPVEQLAVLPSIATVRSPHRLQGLPQNCAVPIQLADIPLLLWHHAYQGQVVLECHVAGRDTETLRQILPEVFPIEDREALSVL